jgi:hypothetical protein
MAASEIGRKLVDLHLLRTRHNTTTSFSVAGNNLIKFVRFDNGKIHINETQFFGAVPDNVWDYEMCGYKVIDKWLKSRLRMELAGSEVEHLLQVIETIKRTIILTEKLDKIANELF